MDSRSQKPIIATRANRHAVVERVRCTACGICEEVCPHGAIHVSYVANIDRDRCVGCGVCVENCPVGAIHLAGEASASASTKSER